MILPFFNRFIREGGFSVWRQRLIGTEEERDRHPFTWTYDEATEEVHFVNKRVDFPHGDVEVEEHAFTVGERLIELLHRQVPKALAEIRSAVVDKPDHATKVLAAYRVTCTGNPGHLV